MLSIFRYAVSCGIFLILFTSISSSCFVIVFFFINFGFEQSLCARNISVISHHDPSSPLFLMVAHNAPHSANGGAVLQASPQDVRAMRHVESPDRRIYAGTKVRTL